MEKYKFSISSIIISVGCVVYLLILNYNLAQHYLSADGKTQALFGIIELTWLSYKIYVVPFLMLSLVFWILSIRKKEAKSLSILAAILSTLSVVLLFIRFWTWMI
ncbi:MAG: hypothetical protein ACM3H8_10270 [Sphingobacteriales bacterium]